MNFVVRSGARHRRDQAEGSAHHHRWRGWRSRSRQHGGREAHRGNIGTEGDHERRDPRAVRRRWWRQCQHQLRRGPQQEDFGLRSRGRRRSWRRRQRREGDGGSHRQHRARQGKDSTAIFAQSVGGGGGNAEAEDSAVADHLTAPEVALDIVLGSEELGERDDRSSRRHGRHRRRCRSRRRTASSRRWATSRSAFSRRASATPAASAARSSAAISSENEVEVQVGLEGGSGGRAGNVAVTTGGFDRYGRCTDAACDSRAERGWRRWRRRRRHGRAAPGR